MLRAWPIALLAALGISVVLCAQTSSPARVEVVQTRPKPLRGLRLLRAMWDDDAFRSEWQGLRWQKEGQSGFLPFPAQLVNDERSQLFFAEGRAWAFGRPRCPLPGSMGRIPLLVYVSHDLRTWAPFGSPLHPTTRYLAPLRDGTFLAWSSDPRPRILPPFANHLGLDARGRFTPLPSQVESPTPISALGPVRTPDALVLASRESLVCLSPQDGRPLCPALDAALGVPGAFPIRLLPRPDGRVLVLSAHAQAFPDLWELRESPRASTRHGAAALNWLRLHGSLGWPRNVSGHPYRLLWTLLDPVKGTFHPLARPQGFPATLPAMEVYGMDLAMNPEGSLRWSFR